MSLSGVSVTFTDGNLGVAVPGPGGAQAKIGVSLSGAELTPVSCGNTTVVASTLGGGPLCDASAQLASVAGVPVIAVPCPIVTNGSIASLTGGAGAFTHVGTGAGAVTATVVPHVAVLAKVIAGGTLGTATVAFSVNGGAYGAAKATTATSWVHRPLGAFCVLTFAAATYRADDVYTFNADGTTDRTSGAPDTVTAASSPIDAYDVLVTVKTAGARGTAQFTYSLDGGANTSNTITTAATYVIPGSGIKLAFSDAAYVLDDTYEAVCVPPSTNSTNVGLALDALIASSYAWEGVHVVGEASSAANAAALAVVVDGKMTTAAASQKYKWAICECPHDTTNTDAVDAAAFASTASAKGRIFEALASCDLVSPLTALTLKRNVAWALSPRLASSRLSESPGKVKLGPVPNVRALHRDEANTPGMADARFVVMRTREGKNGFWFEKHPTLAAVGSDYSRIMNVRVINRAATLAVAAFTDEVSDDVRADPTTGFIDERDAQAIDASVTGELKAQLMGAPGTQFDECSNVQAQVGREDNLSSTETMTATVLILPKNYTSNIAVNIGFTNPALQG
jgi:hypothetical protein